MSYYITVAVVRKSGDSWPGSASESHRLQSRSWPGLGSSEISTQAGSTFKLTDMVVAKIQFLVGCWTEGFSFLPVVGQELPSIPCHVGLSNMAAYFIEVSKQRSKESASKMEVTVFCNLILQTRSHHFCLIVYVSAND